MEITDYKKDAQKPMSGEELIEEYAKGRRDFSNVTFEAGTSLSFEDLRGANFSHANFSGMNLNVVDISGAKLDYARFYKTRLICVNFSGSDLEGANFSDARLPFSDLSFTNLAHANFSHADLRYADLSNVISLKRAAFGGADLSSANLVNAADLEHVIGIIYAIFECTHVTAKQKKIIMDARNNPDRVRLEFDIDEPNNKIPARK